MTRVLVISDTQFPFHHKDIFSFLEHIRDTYKPDQVVHIGDLVDFHALSDYPTDPDADSVGLEFEKAQVQIGRLASMFPEVTVLESNHDERFYKRLMKAGIPRRFWPSYEKLFETPPGWSWKPHIKIDDIVYIHGHQVPSSGGNVMQNAMKKYMRSIVFGHFHTRFGIDYYANEDSLMFGMCVGSLIDHKQYAFNYQSAEIRKPLIGIGLVDDGIPFLIPMHLNSKGAWRGFL